MGPGSAAGATGLGRDAGASALDGGARQGDSGEGGTVTDDDAGAGDASTCGAQAECGGACVDTTSDSLNCGACGVVCPGFALEVCSLGACQPSCPAGQMVLCGIGGLCVDTGSDPGNCGDCGQACAPSEVCSSGICQAACAAGLTACGRACVDLEVDPQSCGGCGESCQGGACNAGACRPVPITLATGQGQPKGIAVDAEAVYWTDFAIGTTTGTVMKCAIGGCDNRPTTLAVGTNPLAIALDATNVYWIDSGAQTVMMCPKTGCGGKPTVMASGQLFFFESSQTLTVDSTYVYWTTTGSSGDGDPPTQPVAGTLMKCAIAGCPEGPTTLASTSPATSSEWQGITLFGGELYWGDFFAGTLLGCPAAGCNGSPQILASQVSPVNLAANATSLFWTNLGTVMTCDTPGCGNPTAIASGQSNAYGLALDTTSVYWTNDSMPDYYGGYLTWGTVMKCDLGGCGGAPTILALDQSDPYGIAVDATSVYWTDEGNGTVLKAPK